MQESHNLNLENFLPSLFCPNKLLTLHRERRQSHLGSATWLSSRSPLDMWRVSSPWPYLLVKHTARLLLSQRRHLSRSAEMFRSSSVATNHSSLHPCGSPQGQGDSGNVVSTIITQSSALAADEFLFLGRLLPPLCCLRTGLRSSALTLLMPRGWGSEEPFLSPASPHRLLLYSSL